MKALLSKAVGGPETLVLDDLPDPRPMKGEVLVAVRAVGVNFPDVLIIEDKYQFKPERPFAPGGEIAGVVEAVGEGVTAPEGRRPGDGHDRLGRHGREDALVDATRCMPMPARHGLRRRRRLRHDLRHLAPRPEGPRQAEGRRDPAGAGRRRRRRASPPSSSARPWARGWSPPSRRRTRSGMAQGARRRRSVVYPPGPFDKDGLKALAEQFK